MSKKNKKRLFAALYAFYVILGIGMMVGIKKINLYSIGTELPKCNYVDIDWESCAKLEGNDESYICAKRNYPIYIEYDKIKNRTKYYSINNHTPNWYCPALFCDSQFSTNKYPNGEAPEHCIENWR